MCIPSPGQDSIHDRKQLGITAAVFTASAAVMVGLVLTGRRWYKAMMSVYKR